MDILIFIKSVSKVAIVAFFLTGFSLLYEIYLFVKHDDQNKKLPKIPELQTVKIQGLQKNLTVVKKSNEIKTIFKRPNNLVVVILIVVLASLGSLMAISRGVKDNQPIKSLVVTPAPAYQILSSEGIKIYNDLWQDLSLDQLRFFQAGHNIIIGVQNIPNADIVKARIRLNAKQWSIKDETENLNHQLNVFYRNYTIATNDAQLKIEAQLYSQKEGWLGE